MGKQTLFIAAGHGGTDKGNTTAGIVERDELIAIVGGMRHWLQQAGYLHGLGGVIFLEDRLDLAGEIAALDAWKLTAADGDMAVDFHLDYRAGRADGGALVLYDETPYALAFGQQFLTHWCAATGIKNNGNYRSNVVAKPWRGWDDFGFCRPRWPGVIVELGCLNCAHDMRVVRSPYFQALAAQIALNVWQQVAP